MTITTDHAASSYGVPVILDADGHPLDYAPGLQAVRRHLGLSTAELGAACGRSSRTVENWEQGRTLPPTEALYVLAALLRDREAAASETTRPPTPPKNNTRNRGNPP